MPLELPNPDPYRGPKPSLRKYRSLGNPSRNATVFLYLAKCQGFIKLGVTQSPKLRISAMQGGCPWPIELVATFPVSGLVAPEIEHKVQLLLDDKHHFGEWFKCSKTEALHAVHKAMSEPQEKSSSSAIS